MNRVQRKLMITGKVQGVGYRHFTRKEALALGVGGWVRNLRDGRVEAQLQGAPESVEELTRRLGRGPALARVDHMDIHDKTVDEGGLDGADGQFVIRK
jgi:acylphosphatase